MESVDSALATPALTLPTELEREIFEILALSSPKFIPTLLLVAQRVKIWTEPLLYRTLSVVAKGTELKSVPNAIRISPEDCLELVNREPVFFHDHVRYLAFKNLSQDDAFLILSHCHRLAHLAVFSMYPVPSWLPLLAAMPLLEFSANVDRLFDFLEADFRHPLFTSVTHLDLFEVPAAEGWVEALCSLSHLTHLSFNYDERHFPRIPFHRILVSNKSLQVLVLIFMTDDVIDIEDFSFPERKYFTQDPRSVIMVVDRFLDDWEIGTVGGENYWIRAERFIEKRRSGEVPASQYYLAVAS
ncbi:hypothetical protein R3P38DRAFT_2905522 [Favolaschia claudopus]|uniref:F-box domain-containing protein n=1 Tax=Favolaschia claudopus TaxID=2862362 RepID=A0AAW0CKH4_9AGAR